MLRRNLYLAALTLLLAPSLFSATRKHVRTNLTGADISAINQNFKNIDNELSNCVHKRSTETINGNKYFYSNDDVSPTVQIGDSDRNPDFTVYGSGDVVFGTTVGVTLSHGEDGGQIPTGLWYDKTHERLFLRTIIMGEYGDPAEIAIRRSSSTTPGFIGQTAATENLGLIHWSGGTEQQVFKRRSAQIYARAASDITYSSAPGRLYLATQGTDLDPDNDLPVGITIDEYQRVAINGDAPAAGLDVKASSQSAVAFIVKDSGSNTLIYLASATGNFGVGGTPGATARFHVKSESAGSNTGVRFENTSTATSANGVNVFLLADGENNTGDLFIRMVSKNGGASEANWSNGIDVSDAAKYKFSYSGTLGTADRVAISTHGFFHVMPSGTPDVQLEVSDGSTTGGGTVHAASFAAHSSKKLKSDIRYLTTDEKKALYEDIKLLKPAEFRYLSHKKVDSKTMVRDTKQPLRKGLVLEDVPQSFRSKGDAEAISLNDQIFILQAAVQVLIGKVEALEAAKQ